MRPIVPESQPKLGFGVLEVGIALLVQVLAPLEDEGRHPVGIVPIDLPRHTNELVQLPPVLHRDDPQPGFLRRPLAGLVRPGHVVPGPGQRHA